MNADSPLVVRKTPLLLHGWRFDTEPFETAPGAENRTFALRAETPSDTHLLAYVLTPCMERICVLPFADPPDVFMKLTVKEDTLSLEQVRWVIAQVTDFHVAAESLALAHEYTGERQTGAEGERPPESKMTLYTTGVEHALDHYRDTVEELEALLDPVKRRKRELDNWRHCLREIVSPGMANLSDEQLTNLVQKVSEALSRTPAEGER